MSASLVGSEMCIRDRSRARVPYPPRSPSGAVPSDSSSTYRHSPSPSGSACLLYTSDAADDM
eukprot:5315004-Alexandrium_andersonii.AAC.1